MDAIPAKKQPDTSAIILAGGIGERFGDPVGKQFVELCGRPLAAWAIQAFADAPSTAEIVVVCSPDRQKLMLEQVIEPLELSVPVYIADAGPLRQDSCYNGLQRAHTQDIPYVAIHDAARPLIEVSAIEQAMEMLRSHKELDGVVCGLPAEDTIKLCDEAIICETPARIRCWQAQTPQIFPSQAIVDAHEAARKQGIAVTDDATFVELRDGKVKCCSVGWGNMKVTVPNDMLIAEAVLRSRETCS